MSLRDFKFVVVGAGCFGATISERLAADAGQPVLVIEKRRHLGGNSYSEIEPSTGIDCHIYGSHIFHTHHQDVWRYLHRFARFNNYRHQVLAVYKGRVFPVAINLATINAFYGKSFKPAEALEFVKAEAAKVGIATPCNFEEKAISQIGRPLYEAFIKGYSKKQWGADFCNLPASIVNRIPIRFDYNQNYFDDPYEGIPADGYGKLFEKMFSHPNIKIRTNTDYFQIRHELASDAVIIYSGPVDRLFDYCYGQLTWRTLSFEKEILPVSDYQGTSVMNYVEESVPFTRIHEFKHFYPEKKHNNQATVIYKEYSHLAKKDDDEFYPVNTKEDEKRLSRYEADVKKVPRLICGGRLGAYRYFDMDDAIKSGLETYESLKAGGLF